MKLLIGLLALLAFSPIPVLATNGWAGIDGHVVGPDGQPVANATVAIFRLPLHQVDRAVAAVKTNSNGYFLKLALQPGRYMVDVNVPGNVAACAVHDLIDDSVTRVTMRLHAESGCAPVRMHSALVNGSLTGDLYIVH